MAVPMLEYLGLGPIGIQRLLARDAVGDLLLHPHGQGCILCPRKGCTVAPEYDPSYQIGGLMSWEAVMSPFDPHSTHTYVSEGNLWIETAVGNVRSGMHVFDDASDSDFDSVICLDLPHPQNGKDRDLMVGQQPAHSPNAYQPNSLAAGKVTVQNGQYYRPPIGECLP